MNPIRRILFACAMLVSLVGATGFAAQGYTCSSCYQSHTGEYQGCYYYDLFFNNAFYASILVGCGSLGQCELARSSDARCALTPPPPAPPPTPSDYCSPYTSLGVSACMNHSGCDWSTDSRRCFIKYGMPCDYYTIHGVEACMSSSDQCDWSTDAHRCYRK